MTPTIDYLRTQFIAFNARYFGGELPEPQFKINCARTLLGRFSCRKVRQGLLGLRHSEEYAIAISRFYDLNERDVQTVLLHEMIHFHICFHHMTDTSSHGVLFRREMERINADGWNISVRTSTKGWQINDDGRRRTKRFVVALTTSDGFYFTAIQRPYVKVLDREMLRVSGLERWEWYFTDDEFFVQFPLVRSLRFRRVSAEEFDAVCKRMRDKGERLR